MREIKFRAWDEDEKIMRNISCIFWNTLEWYISRFELDGKDMKSGMPIMQYTGKKDKNDKEIYEGDIVEHKQEPTEINHIEYYDAQYHLEPHGLRLCDEYGEIEIIGNIYENPDLIKSKKEAK